MVVITKPSFSMRQGASVRTQGKRGQEVHGRQKTSLMVFFSCLLWNVEDLRQNQKEER